MTDSINNSPPPAAQAPCAPANYANGGYGKENPVEKQLQLLLLVDFIKGAKDQMDMLKTIQKESRIG